MSSFGPPDPPPPDGPARPEGTPPYTGPPTYAGQPPYLGQPPYQGQPSYQGQPPYPGGQPYQGQPPYPGGQPYQGQPPYPGGQPYPDVAGGDGPYPGGGSATTRQRPRELLSRLHPLDLGVPVAALLALIFSFLAFYSYDPKGPATRPGCSSPGDPAIIRDFCDGGTTTSAWHGFFGWFGVVLLLIAGFAVIAAALAPRASAPGNLRLVSAAAAAVAVLSLVVALFVVPDIAAIKDLVLAAGGGQTFYNRAIDNGHGFAFYVVLILAVIALVLTVLRMLQTGAALPARDTTGARSTPAPAWGGPIPADGTYGGAPVAPPRGGPPPAYLPPGVESPRAWTPPLQQTPPGYSPPPGTPMPSGYAPPAAPPAAGPTPPPPAE